jgi:hypothetical protein
LCWRYWQNPPGHLRTSKPVNLLCWSVMIYRVALSFQVSVNESKVTTKSILNIFGNICILLFICICFEFWEPTNANGKAL